MGSIRLEGIRFVVYTMDHEPKHVHGFYAEVEVILDLLPDGDVALANRKDPVRPADASRSDVRHALTVAAGRFDELVQLWEKHHG
jgi:hypothetical protein